MNRCSEGLPRVSGYGRKAVTQHVAADHLHFSGNLERNPAIADDLIFLSKAATVMDASNIKMARR
jgi:hypothetical protein